ncbi:prolipoprotein diacylglyceryl transferase [Alkalitalea saponilacus]|uniref:Phosphatidylglycerol--prolipoprotein diacylglyceryl transferase n=1 Tax=Alkalitalea saponilacus TaxID=889453 RepID=A0A1T5DDU4_9BACT|nr:prolipoprotein diacylglyceryl transferase [Alkalitalea saponilacus]ASB50671.1 prolipoprotein diacylglyceryl transferase [Alkalitalea saponilacus]SKB69771.1 prolipoprotein diacylglyceryl transferase [Alkalitalea saponilacus]
MELVNYITWAPNPEIFSLGPLSVRYYGLFFAMAFLLGYYLVDRMFRRDNAPEEWMEKLFIYVMVATVIGARLGHVFFYGWDYYSQNPGEILMVWRGGLASHGGAIGILVAIWLYSKLVTKRSMLWTMDKLVIAVALAAVFIRLGNLMNSEIIGSPTTVPWAFVFEKAHVHNPEIPRHPAQLYEAISYLITFIVLIFMYWKTNAAKRQGLIFGVFLIGIFATRILIEFVKENQEAFEETMTLNMGQILSIPFVILAGVLIYQSFKKPLIDTAITGKQKRKK